MRRAIVLIGVASPGNPYAELKAVYSGLDSMRGWAKTQGFEAIRELKDEDGTPVTGEAIFNVIQGLLDDPSTAEDLIDEAGTLDQLVIYFSGHGFMNRGSEYWVLNGANVNPNAAVNVEASFDNALFSQVPHIVFISDACRTTVAGMRQSEMRGTVIFPMSGLDEFEKGVDIFYAAKRGAKALEVSSAKELDKQYKAVYTSALVHVLSGEEKALIENGFVRPHPVKEDLKTRVPRLLDKLGVPLHMCQEPDGRVTSGQHAFLSILTPPKSQTGDSAAPPADPRPTPPQRTQGNDEISPDRDSSFAWKDAAGDRLTQAVHAVVSGAVRLNVQTDVGFAAEVKGNSELTLLEVARNRVASLADLEDIHTSIPGYWPGLLVRGRSIKWVKYQDKFQMFLIPVDMGTVVHLEQSNGHTSPNAFVCFEDGSGTVIPVFRFYICVLDVGDQGVFSISYVPMYPSLSDDREDYMGGLRAAMDVMSETFLLDLDDPTAETLVDRVCGAPQVDPMLAIEVAYACRDIGRLDLVANLHNAVRRELGTSLFDLALLSGELRRCTDARCYPPPSVPILAQGWVHLDALAGGDNEALHEISRHMLGSAWSHYDDTGMYLLNEWSEAQQQVEVQQLMEGGAAA